MLDRSAQNRRLKSRGRLPVYYEKCQEVLLVVNVKVSNVSVRAGLLEQLTVLKHRDYYCIYWRVLLVNETTNI